MSCYLLSFSLINMVVNEKRIQLSATLLKESLNVINQITGSRIHMKIKQYYWAAQNRKWNKLREVEEVYDTIVVYKF